MLNIACMVTSATGSPTLPTTQACSDATLALATNTACTQALADINSPTGSEVVCGEQCRGLLLSFFQNCPNEVAIHLTLIFVPMYFFLAVL